MRQQLNTKNTSNNSTYNSNNLNNFDNEIFDPDSPLSEKLLYRLINDLERNYKKELCQNQLDIVYNYSEKGKFLLKNFPKILNSTNPLKRYRIFQVILDNIYEWPKDEKNFNSVICFLPKNEHNKAMEYIRVHNRGNCCNDCLVF